MHIELPVCGHINPAHPLLHSCAFSTTAYSAALDLDPALAGHSLICASLRPQRCLLCIISRTSARFHSPKSRPTPYVTCRAGSSKLSERNRKHAAKHGANVAAQHALHSPQRCLMTSLQPEDILFAAIAVQYSAFKDELTPMAIRPPMITRMAPRSMLAPPRAAPTAPKMASPSVDDASTTYSLQAHTVHRTPRAGSGFGHACMWAL